MPEVFFLWEYMEMYTHILHTQLMHIDSVYIVAQADTRYTLKV